MPYYDLSGAVVPNQVIYYYIPGYDNIYACGDDPSLWSRWVPRGRWSYIGDAWRQLKTPPDSEGYPQATLCRLNGTHETIRLHILVAWLFIGPNPDPARLEVGHDDGNPLNCRPDNLKYITGVENQADRFRHGTDQLGERNPNVFLTQETVDMLREDYASGKYNQRQLAKKYLITFQTVSLIVRNKRWKQ